MPAPAIQTVDLTRTYKVRRKRRPAPGDPPSPAELTALGRAVANNEIEGLLIRVATFPPIGSFTCKSALVKICKARESQR
jgi:hypothetical protein